MEANSSSRVFHIDTLRGVAILMMLQGHLVDTFLVNEDRIGLAHGIWKFCRGLTAPVFFTTSGVIVVYLLVRKVDINYRSIRMKKAFWRGLEVLMWGYLLRFSFWPFFFNGEITQEFWRIDVLNCIGVGLIMLSTIFFISKHIHLSAFRIFLLILALSVFLFHPWYSVQDYTNWPPALRNYFTLKFGSVFTLFPFLGFLLVGGFIGSMYTILYERNKGLFVVGLIAIGILFFNSSPIFYWIYQQTDIILFKNITTYNWFIKLGMVLIIYAIFVSAEPLMAKLKTINLIGQHTLTVYIIHFFILFGSWFGLGLDDILFEKRSLPAEAVIPGALTFVILVSWLTLKYHKWKDRGYTMHQN
jgi:uncharacterized membrane protein